MQGRLKVLICGRDEVAARRLGEHLARLGVQHDWARSAQDVRQKLALKNYDAMTMDLILRDQDGISLIHELRREGHDLPILGTSLRAREHPPASALHAAVQADWLDKAASQARALFAFRIADGRLADFRPRILHVEADAYSRQVMAGALPVQALLTGVADLAAAEQVLAVEEFDFAILNPDFCKVQTHDAVQDFLARHPQLPVIFHTTQDIPLSTDTPCQILAGLTGSIRTCAMMGFRQPLMAQA